jgi:hypothetical protein
VAEPKTRMNDADVDDFLDSVHNKSKAEDARKLLEWMSEASGCPPKMWGASIIGFGTYEQTGADGKKTLWMRIGFSPRRRELVAYLMKGFDAHGELLSKLGKHKTGKSCLYIKRLSDIDETVLKQLFAASLHEMSLSHP